MQETSILQEVHDLGFKGLIKSKLKVIKPEKHLLFFRKQHIKKRDVINVLIPNPPHALFVAFF